MQVTVPDYGTITVDVPTRGAFYLVEEQTGKVTLVEREAGALRCHGLQVEGKSEPVTVTLPKAGYVYPGPAASSNSTQSDIHGSPHGMTVVTRNVADPI